MREIHFPETPGKPVVRAVWSLILRCGHHETRPARQGTGGNVANYTYRLPPERVLCKACKGPKTRPKLSILMVGRRVLVELRHDARTP